MSCRPYINDEEQDYLVTLLSQEPHASKLTPMLLLRKLVHKQVSRSHADNRQAENKDIKNLHSLGMNLGMVSAEMQGKQLIDLDTFDEAAFLAATSISSNTLDTLQGTGISTSELAQLLITGNGK
jgi:hypothetical protein